MLSLNEVSIYMPLHLPPHIKISVIGPLIVPFAVYDVDFISPVYLTNVHFGILSKQQKRVSHKVIHYLVKIL